MIAGPLYGGRGSRLVDRPGVRQGHVRKGGRDRVCRNVDSVTSCQGDHELADPGSLQSLDLDVDDVVVEPAPVRVTGQVSGKHPHPVGTRGRCDRRVEPQLFGGDEGCRIDVLVHLL